MKKILSTVILMGFGAAFAYFAVEAWDYTMTDEEVVYYLEKYPDNEKLQKIAQARDLAPETKHIMDQDANDWVANGTASEDRDGWIHDKAMQIFTNSRENDFEDYISYEDALKVAEQLYNETQVEW